MSNELDGLPAGENKDDSGSNSLEIGEELDGLPAPYIQETLFHTETQIEYDGIEMGVLENGIPYLSETGLARMCGIGRSTLYDLSANWPEERIKSRGKQINVLLKELKYNEDSLYLKSEHGGKTVNAYTEPVCLAILEYYAFIADKPRKEAVNAFRSLARVTFRTFIYKATGYSPEQTVLKSWKHFHDRVDMTTGNVPDGYFSIFTEIAFMLVPMIRSGIIISDKVIPDISVGITWGKFWKDENLDEKCGNREKYPHEYPLYYPQSRSNPQPAYAYPDKGLGIFRKWLRQNYIETKFPKYLMGQVKKGTLQVGIVQKTLKSFESKRITSPYKTPAKLNPQLPPIKKEKFNSFVEGLTKPIKKQEGG